MRLILFNHFFQIFFLAGATLLLLLIVLSGSIDNFPINEFYWLEADTSNIPNAPDVSRWTFWGICSGSENCNNLAPAYPFSPVDNFSTTENVPSDFIENRSTYYYLTRCSWAFFLISLVFVGVSFICSLFAWFWHSLRSVLTFFITIGIVFQAAAISCETAAIVLGRNAFNNANLDHSLGVKLMGIGWAAFVTTIFSWIGTCCSSVRSSYKKHKELKNQENLQNYPNGNDEDNYPMLTTVTPAPLQTMTQSSNTQNQGTLASNEGGIRFFKIRRNNKEEEESE